MPWKKGRGRLGIFAPLLGTWSAQAESQMGVISCQRSFSKMLNDTHIQLRALWHIGSGTYEEVALFGSDKDGKIRFWSFTSDGKQSQGEIIDVADIHPDAIGFEAQMPAGTARMVYWPDDTGGFHWAVESKTKKGWNRFAEHHYHPDLPSIGS
jgi:WD40 repeat protein